MEVRGGNMKASWKGSGEAGDKPVGRGGGHTTLTIYNTNCCKLPTIGFDLITSAKMASKHF